MMTKYHILGTTEENVTTLSKMSPLRIPILCAHYRKHSLQQLDISEMARHAYGLIWAAVLCTLSALATVSATFVCVGR